MTDAPICEGSDDEKALIFSLADQFRALTIAVIPDDLDAMTYGGPAGVVFSGILYGQMIGAGVQTGSRAERRQMLRAIEQQFLTGVNVGLRSAARIAAQEGLVQ